MTDLIFNFFQHWYPISPIADLDPDRPTPIMILGIKIVVWKPRTSDRYRVFLDRCPHRLAPLSEGRVDDKTGQLMCSYHGWQFDEHGVCTDIPQAEDSEMISKNRDRYHQHTLICGSCRQALKNVHRVQIGLLIYFSIALSIAAVMPDAFRLGISLPLVLTALLGLVIYGGLKYWLEPKFYFVDYVHAQR